MEGVTRGVAFAAVVLALIGGAVALILGAGDDPGPRTGTTAESRPQPETTVADDLKPTRAGRAGAERELVLAKHGNPLVWVKRGEKVDIHAAPGGTVVETVGAETEFGSRTVLSVAQVEGEWAGVPSPFTGNGALGWVRLDGRYLESGYTSLEIVVDISERRTQLFRDGEAIKTFTVSVGAPGTDTPTGRFAVTDTFRGDLNPAYGCCAVALTAVQPNLPSGWLGGNRIAIHGTSGPLGAAVSSGCVRAADRDVSALVEEVPPGVPVTIRQ
ncbi:MAG: L,D-transpeptidase [Solirubrobacterales bacterium]